MGCSQSTDVDERPAERLSAQKVAISILEARDEVPKAAASVAATTRAAQAMAATAPTSQAKTIAVGVREPRTVGSDGKKVVSEALVQMLHAAGRGKGPAASKDAQPTTRTTPAVTAMQQRAMQQRLAGSADTVVRCKPTPGAFATPATQWHTGSTTSPSAGKAVVAEAGKAAVTAEASALDRLVAVQNASPPNADAILRTWLDRSSGALAAAVASADGAWGSRAVVAKPPPRHRGLVIQRLADASAPRQSTPPRLSPIHL